MPIKELKSHKKNVARPFFLVGTISFCNVALVLLRLSNRQAPKPRTKTEKLT